MSIWYVLLLVSVLENGQEVTTELDKFREVAQCIDARDMFNKFLTETDLDEIDVTLSKFKVQAKCYDQYGHVVSGEV